MSTKGLTRTQASVIVAMRSGIQLLYKPETPRTLECYWLTNASMQGVTHTARALEREGYIEKHNQRASGCCELLLTEKGMKA